MKKARWVPWLTAWHIQDHVEECGTWCSWRWGWHGMDRGRETGQDESDRGQPHLQSSLLGPKLL